MEYKSRTMPIEEAILFYEAVEAISDDVERKEAMRELARWDLFYLGVNIIGRQDLVHPWLYERIREFEAEPNGCLDLWAREHYKSTIITFLGTIQEIIRDAEITIGLFSNSREISASFLRQIKNELTMNTLLKWLFDDILWSDPAKQAPKWSEDDGLVVKRKTNPKEATLEAWGLVDKMPTGKHFKLRVYDDVVTDKSVTNPKQIHKTTAQWRLSDNLSAKGGWQRVVGTRYSQFDTHRVMIDEGLLKPRVHPATSDGSDDTRKSVFMPPAVLAQKRKNQGIYIFNCQMLQNPVSDKVQGFKEEWLRYWSAKHTKNLKKIVLVDPSSGKRADHNDYSSFWVVGLGPDRNYYVCDIIRDRLNLTERTEMLYSLDRKWQPVQIFYEQYGMLSDVEHFNDVGKRENYRLKITSINSPLKKEDRIKTLVPLFEQGRIYLPDSMIKHDWENKSVNLVRAFIEEEYTAFPVLAHDDMLDSLAQLKNEEVVKIEFPGPPKEEGFNAIQEIRRRERANRPVV